MKIVFATNNEHKLKEIREILGDKFEIVSLKDIGCDVDIPETGNTLEENAHQKAEYIFDHYGYEILDRSLRLALGTWEGEPISLTSGMLKGIAMLISAYGDSLDDETFKEHVGKYSAKAISRNAKDRRPGTIGFAEALVIVYNGQKKKHLSLKKLYWSNGRKKGAAPPDFETDT